MNAPQRMCELFKLLRTQELSRSDIAAEMDADAHTVLLWTDELVAHGFLLERKSETRKNVGRYPMVYRLAPEWGGQA
jgi:predicted ArsR family transcriptional regulator